MSKLTYTDKTNRNSIIDRTQQATAEDFNEIKSSANILYARLIDDNSINFYGDTDPAPTPIQDDVRFVKVGANIEMQRYETGAWVQRAIFGSSVESDEFGITTTSGKIYYLTAGNRHFMLSASNDGEGIIVGNTMGETNIASSDDFIVYEPFGVRFWFPRQPLADETLIINGEYTFTIAADVNANVDGFQFISNTAGVKYRVSNATIEGIDLDENVSQYEFDNDQGDITTVGSNTVYLNGTYYSLTGNLYVAKIQTDGPLELQGHTYDIPGVTDGPEFYPAFDLSVLQFEPKSVTRFSRWQEKTYELDDKVWENNDIYICNTAGAQTTDFQTNINKWDNFSRSMQLSKQVQATGILSGGLITQDSTTEISWTEGTGHIAHYTDPTNPQLIDVSWDAVSTYTPINIATDGVIIFAYDDASELVELSSDDIVPGAGNDYIVIGSVLCDSGQIIGIIDSPGGVGYDGIGSYSDFVNFVIGPANISGNIYGDNGANLNIDVIGGQAYIKGSNFRNDTEIPDVVTLPSDSAITFLRVYRGADPSTQVVIESSTTLIDPTMYDDGSGTLQSVTAGYWTIQRIFRSRTGSHYVSYGQQEFATKELALEALGSEPFEEKNPLPLTLFRCSLVVSQSATDLSDIAEAEFFEASSFRLRGFSSSASTIPGITNPGGINGNLQFNNSGAFGGSNNLTWLLNVLGITGDIDVSGNVINDDVILNTQVRTEANITNGFVDSATDVTCTFTDGTRTLEISPTTTNFVYWSNGIKYTKTSAEDITILDVEGSWYIYYNGSTLERSQVWDDDYILKYGFVACLYWDATNKKQIYFGREFLHGASMSGYTHKNLHTTRGFALEIGGGLTDILADESGNSLTHAQFGNELTIAFDEDVEFLHLARLSTGTIPIYYRSGVEASNIWRIEETNNYPVVNTGSGRAGWNELTGGSWQITEVANNDFVLAHVLTTNDIDRPYIVFMGQATYPTRNQARDGAEIEVQSLITTGLPLAEFKFLGTIILQTSDSYNVSNTSRSRIRTTNDGDDYIDLRGAFVVTGATTSTYHNGLPGLQGGTADEYYHLTESEYTDLIPEAPEDGKQYARKDGAWEEVASSGSPLFLSFGPNDALFPSSNPAGAYSRNGHPILNFDDTIAESIIFKNNIQSGYDGEDINVDIYWVAETATTGAVTWGVEFERNTPSGNDIDSDSFATQQTGNSTTNGTSGVITNTTVTLTQTEADGVIANDYFRMKIERVTGDGGDNMSGDAQILRVVVRV